MLRVRTIESAYKEMHEKDPGCAISRSMLRKLVTEGYIPSKKSGNRYLITMEDVYGYFDMGERA